MTRLLQTLDLVVSTRVKWSVRPGHRKHIAKQTKNKIVDLGPTFVKIGQYVSTRNDIFPQELTDELCKLQDDVLPMDWEEVNSVISKQTMDVTDISHKPIASASLGQVHLGKLQDKTVAIKVLRPGVVHKIENDVENLKFISNFFKIFNSTASRDLITFVEELEEMLKLETDYEKESENTKMFARNFKDFDWVIVPDVYYASKDVLVMEYVPSTKITEATGYDKKSLTWAITKSQILQILNSGFFHGDPHPGNVGIKDGKLVYYDFGMVSQISIKQKNTLIALLIAITNENEDQILAILNTLGLVNSNAAGLRKFVQFFLTYIQKNKVENPEQVQELLEIQNNPIKFSGSFFYLIRSFALIEGTCKQLDPEYSSSKMLQRYVKESDVMEDAVVTSIRNTFSDISGVSYRLSMIERTVKTNQVKNQQLLTFISVGFITLLFNNNGVISGIIQEFLDKL